jgi:hypothetical protein
VRVAFTTDEVITMMALCAELDPDDYESAEARAVVGRCKAMSIRARIALLHAGVERPSPKEAS